MTDRARGDVGATREDRKYSHEEQLDWMFCKGIAWGILMSLVVATVGFLYGGVS